MVIETGNIILSTLTLVGNIFIILFLVHALYIKLFSKENKISKFFTKNALKFSLITALMAMLGSLFYSEIANYTPCELCWYQRILMYPLVLILGIALYKKDYKIKNYVIPISIIGSLIALYHYSIQRLSIITSCSADAVSCTSKYAFHYGYITIPLMAFTAFMMIIIFMHHCKNK
ncbi:disulfide bond formation protein B [Candidatus Woesearchaeota archaeon]|nr:disulfide bond formation protein B [Candidatus Woesearchaeota archaeon]